MNRMRKLILDKNARRIKPAATAGRKQMIRLHRV